MPDPSTDDDAFWLEVFGQGPRTVVALHGALDLAAADYVRAAFREAELTNAHPIFVDLAEMTFLDVVGFRVLFSESTRMAGRLALGRARPSVRRMFELTRTTDRLTDGNP